MSELPEKNLKRDGPAKVVFYNKLSWFVSELPGKDISSIVFQCPPEKMCSVKNV